MRHYIVFKTALMTSICVKPTSMAAYGRGEGTK